MSNTMTVFEMLHNNSMNMDILSETLQDIKNMNYEKLRIVERHLLGMDRFDFDMTNESVVRTVDRLQFGCNIDFVGKDNRIEFRKSPFYKTILSLNDIKTNRDLFLTSVMVFIDGYLYENVYVEPNEAITNVIFNIYGGFPTPVGAVVRDGFTVSEVDALVENNAHVTILFVPNMYQSTYVANTYTLKNYTLEQYAGIPIALFDDVNDIPPADTQLSFVAKDDTHLFRYTMVDSTVTDNKLYFDTASQISTMTNTYGRLLNIYPAHIIERVTVPAGTEWFELPIREMPIDSTLMLPFKYSGNDVIFDHNLDINIYYPNKYHITAQDHDTFIYVFYTDSNPDIGGKYVNELRLYYRFTQNILEKYNNDTIPPEIKLHAAISMNYDIDDYQISDTTEVEYKIDKMKSLVAHEGLYYEMYLNRLVGYVPQYIVDVSAIDDIMTRYRDDNHTEIDDTSLWTTFDTGCYLFIFRHNNNKDRFSLFVDGVSYNPTYSNTDEKYLYVYIPVSIVTPTSIIHIERFTDYEPDDQTMIPETPITYHPLVLNPAQKVRVSDIYMYTMVDSQPTYVDSDLYTLYGTGADDRTYTELNKNSGFVYDTIYVTFDQSLIGTTVYIKTDHTTFTANQVGNATFTINRVMKNDQSNCLLFKNGKLMPYQARQIRFNDLLEGPHTFKFLTTIEPDDRFSLVCNSNKYRLIHYMERIPSNGLINLADVIDKPLSFKWHDFYLNGSRLWENNIEFVSPYIMLISNVHTLKNLEIYEKNFDTDDIFGNDGVDDSTAIYDLIIDDINTGVYITDEEDDILNDIIIDYLDFFDRYLYDLPLINPDLNQITPEIILEFPKALNSNYDFLIYPDNTICSEKNYVLNPDKNTVEEY